MTDTSALLRSIDATLKELLREVKARSARAQGAGAPSTPTAAPEVASDAELDSANGDPIVTVTVPAWKGEQFKGVKMSACSPEFLDALALLKDYHAKKEQAEDKKTARGYPAAPFSLRVAKLARGWAARLRRDGTTSPTAPAPVDPFSDDTAQQDANQDDWLGNALDPVDPDDVSSRSSPWD